VGADIPARLWDVWISSEVLIASCDAINAPESVQAKEKDAE